MMEISSATSAPSSAPLEPCFAPARQSPRVSDAALVFGRILDRASRQFGKLLSMCKSDQIVAFPFRFVILPGSRSSTHHGKDFDFHHRIQSGGQDQRRHSERLVDDKIVLANSHSTDRTAEIAEGLGARVVQISITTFSELRNSAADACAHEWI